jgi:hypothetical protein
MSGKQWWSAAELAAAELPEMPGTARGVNRMAAREAWAAQRVIDGMRLGRRRKGRGGGWEYHMAVLPAAAQVELRRRQAKTVFGRMVWWALGKFA